MPISFKTLAILAFALSACGADMGDNQSAFGDENGQTPQGEQAAAVGQVDSALFGSDSCKNVDVAVINGRDGGRKKIVGVWYEDLSDGEGRGEDLDNQILEQSHDRKAWSPNLQHAKGDRIGRWRVHYRTWRGSNLWNDAEWTGWLTPEEGTNNPCKSDESNYTIQLPFIP